MPYRVGFTPAARRQFLSLPRDAQARIQRKIDALAINPRPPSMEFLTAGGGRVRIRIGDYRVIYRVTDAELFVLVLAVGNRREVYRSKS